MIPIAYKTIHVFFFSLYINNYGTKKKNRKIKKETIKRRTRTKYDFFKYTTCPCKIDFFFFFFFPLRLFLFTFSFSQPCRAVTICTSVSILLILLSITSTTTASSSNSEAGLCMMTTIATRFRTACTTSRCTPSVFIHIGKYIYTLA